MVEDVFEPVLFAVIIEAGLNHRMIKCLDKLYRIKAVDKSIQDLIKYSRFDISQFNNRTILPFNNFSELPFKFIPNQLNFEMEK